MHLAPRLDSSFHLVMRASLDQLAHSRKRFLGPSDRAGSRLKKKLSQMMGMQAKAIDPYVKEKGEGHVWGFVTHFHSIAL